MQFKKTHPPSASRTTTYSSSLLNKSTTRKKTAFTQTEDLESSFPFDEWLESRLVPKDELVLNENTTKAYTKALQYINNLHSYMNKKLSDTYGQCGDTKPQGSTCFKLPEVPNYATVFLLLLEKSKDPTLISNKGNTFKNSEMETKKYTTNESVLEFVPEIKKLPEYQSLEQTGALEHLKSLEQEVQTVIAGVKDDESISGPSKSLSGDISSFSSKKSNNIKSLSSIEAESLEKDKIIERNGIQDEDVDNHGKDKEEQIMTNFKVVQETTKQENADLTSDIPTIDEEAASKGKSSDSSLNDEKIMMEIIRQRVQEEITLYLDKQNPSLVKEEQHPRLMRSHFHVVNIPPQINLLEYAQKKLERQLSVDPRSNVAENSSQRQPPACPISARKINVRPSTPKKVTNMFRRLSQENFRGLDVAKGIKLLNGEYEQSDGDSVILDDEEFEKINGPLDDQTEKKQKRCCTAGLNVPSCKEKSNPLKLSLRDMTRVNDKMLRAIGLFTERGDIRPGVIDILEEQKRAKAKDSRNKQFRSRRQWDLQIHLDPKGLNSSFTSVSTEKSFISLSSTDLRSDDIGTVKNVSQRIDYDE